MGIHYSMIPTVAGTSSRSTSTDEQRQVAEFKSDDSVTILPNLRFKRYFAAGAYGNVWGGEHIGKLYAVKVAKPKNDATRQRLLTEIAFGLSLAGNPNLVPMLEAHTTNDSRFVMVMPYVKYNLFDLCVHRTKGRYFSVDLINGFLYDIATAIKYVHDRGYFYRDMKPENILISQDGHFMLADFGLIEKVPDREDSNGFCLDVSGTAEYLAPEVVCNDTASGLPADWWGLGAILWILYTGEVVFTGTTKREVLKSVLDYSEYCSNNWHIRLGPYGAINLLHVCPHRRAGYTEIMSLFPGGISAKARRTIMTSISRIPVNDYADELCHLPDYDNINTPHEKLTMSSITSMM